MPVTAPPDPYREALERLYGLERGNRGPFGLEGTRALLGDLGNPERAFQSIHVAGTNGKGSTCAFLERILRATGWKTGLFTSPHLVDFRERIRVDGRMVAAKVVTRDLERIVSVPAGTGRTFFEATFALGALAFASEKVDIAVLESGLGGRLDATNVVSPALCVITPIGLDHQEMLGDTIEAIAGEKAGIMKPGVPVLLGRQDPRARQVLEQRAREAGAPCHHVEDMIETTIHAIDRGGSDVTFKTRTRETRVGLRVVGRHQVENAALAMAAAMLHEPLVAPGRGLAEARWPGRFEHAPRFQRVWWDGAHNPQGACVLRETWREAMRDEPARLVIGVSTDKDLDGILAALAGPWPHVYAVQSNAPRAMKSSELGARIQAAWPRCTVHVAPRVQSAIPRAMRHAPSELILVCGSLFVVGEAMACLGADLEQL